MQVGKGPWEDKERPCKADDKCSRYPFGSGMVTGGGGRPWHPAVLVSVHRAICTMPVHTTNAPCQCTLWNWKLMPRPRLVGGACSNSHLLQC